jgi:predicted thioredoxin/glutaredoxin
MFTVYYHPACYTSYSLLRALKSNDMVKSVKLVDMSVNYHLAISRQILTVPLIESNGNQVYGGPIDIEKAVSLISNGTLSLDVENVKEALVLAVADSAAVSSILYSHGNLGPLREFNGFLSSATGIALDKMHKEKLGEIHRIIDEDSGLYDEIERKMIVTLAYNKVREAIYMDINDQSPESFIAWLVSKASIGRAGVPFQNTAEMRQKALKIYEYYAERKERIEEKLLREIQEIKSGLA